jgi:hypothetical protein
MADDQHDYKVSPGRPPLHIRFREVGTAGEVRVGAAAAIR